MSHYSPSCPPSPAPLLSVVIPVYNEVDNVMLLADEVAAALRDLAVLLNAHDPANQQIGAPGERINLTAGWELIFVDDGSDDGTGARLQALAETRPEIRVMRHRGNFGQSAAVASGFAAARGQWVGSLDGDGQNDPADLPPLLQTALGEGVDCVTGVRRRRRDTWLRRLSSKVANGFRDRLTGDKVTDSACGVRVVRRRALAEVPVFNGMHRFLPTLLRAGGFTVLEQEVNHRERTRGASKYGMHNRLWRGIRDCFGVRWYLARAVPAQRLNTDDDVR